MAKTAAVSLISRPWCAGLISGFAAAGLGLLLCERGRSLVSLFASGSALFEACFKRRRSLGTDGLGVLRRSAATAAFETALLSIRRCVDCRGDEVKICQQLAPQAQYSWRWRQASSMTSTSCGLGILGPANSWRILCGANLHRRLAPSSYYCCFQLYY